MLAEILLNVLFALIILFCILTVIGLIFLILDTINDTKKNKNNEK